MTGAWLKVQSAVIRLAKVALQGAGISLPDEAHEILFLLSPTGVDCLWPVKFWHDVSNGSIPCGENLQTTEFAGGTDFGAIASWCNFP